MSASMATLAKNTHAPFVMSAALPRKALLLLPAIWLTATCHAGPVDQRGRVGVAASAAADPQEGALGQGFSALQKGRWVDAERDFGAVLALQPGHPRALAGLAQALLKLNRAEEAGQRLEQARAAAPDDPVVMLAAARYEAFRGRGEAAMALYRQAAAQAPKDETPYRDMGDLLLNRLKRPAEAVKAYARAIELAPQDGPARFGLAMALLANDRKADALKSLAEAERLTVNDPNPAYMAGRIHASEKRFDAAIAAMGRALESSPAFVPALSDRADLQADAGRSAAAVADYERLMKLQPNNPTTQLKLGMLYQRMGRFAEARNAYLAALQRNDQLAVAYNNLAMMGLRQGKDEGQIEPWARKAVALGAAVPNFHDTLGQVLAAKGDTQGALAAYREAVKLAPGEPELQFHLAQAYEAAGQRGEAKAAYERALAAKGVFEQAPQARQRLQALR